MNGMAWSDTGQGGVRTPSKVSALPLGFEWLRRQTGQAPAAVAPASEEQPAVVLGEMVGLREASVA